MLHPHFSAVYVCHHSDLILSSPYSREISYIAPIYPERHLTWNTSLQGFDSTQTSGPFPLVPVLHLWYHIPPIFFPQHCHADNTRHTTLPAFLFSLPSWAPSLTGCLTAAFKFNLDKAAVLHFKSAPSRTFLCGIILLHLRVFGCYIMQHVLGKTESGCLFKWQLYPRGLPALCVFWLCVHLCCLYKSLPLFSGNYWIPFLYWYGGT